MQAEGDRASDKYNVHSVPKARPDNPALDVRAWRDESYLFMAIWIALVEAHKYSEWQRTQGMERTTLA